MAMCWVHKPLMVLGLPLWFARDTTGGSRNDSYIQLFYLSYLFSYYHLFLCVCVCGFRIKCKKTKCFLTDCHHLSWNGLL